MVEDWCHRDDELCGKTRNGRREQGRVGVKEEQRTDGTIKPRRSTGSNSILPKSIHSNLLHSVILNKSSPIGSSEICQLFISFCSLFLIWGDVRSSRLAESLLSTRLDLGSWVHYLVFPRRSLLDRQPGG